MATDIHEARLSSGGMPVTGGHAKGRDPEGNGGTRRTAVKVETAWNELWQAHRKRYQRAQCSPKGAAATVTSKRFLGERRRWRGAGPRDTAPPLNPQLRAATGAAEHAETRELVTLVARSGGIRKVVF